MKLGHNHHWFDVRATSIRSQVPGHETSWRADFITWSEQNTEAFAGLHNKGKRILLIFDEASAIADPVWEVAEGALTDQNTEIIWLAFGNPTRSNRLVLRHRFWSAAVSLEVLDDRQPHCRRNQQGGACGLGARLWRRFRLLPSSRKRVAAARG